MTSERSQAYGRVMRRIGDATGVKLHDAEIAIIRDAADTLLFAGSAHDSGAAEALLLVERLMHDLAENDRWTTESAQALADDVAGCGPALVTV
ncbi:MAG: hypothetical protein QOI80_1365 [Solirubrobacteraceae bacterium]|jgi:hypothetical protein|nr:hypothetical protein [Solirubrobacteraceae bacterium]